MTVERAKRLEEVGVSDAGALARLAAAAPQEEPKTVQGRPGPTPPARPRSSPGRKADKLGPLDVGAYLTHYGRDFKVKQAAGKKLFLLGQCVFDPSHSKNESSIVQGSDGKLAYHCFHNSCQGKTWNDARKIISGDDSIAWFCPGYDPNVGNHPKAFRQLPPKPQSSDAEKDEASEASQVFDESRPYLLINERGRVKFNPAVMAECFYDKLSPLIYEGANTGDQFYRYDSSGVWKWMMDDEIKQLLYFDLNSHAKPVWINDAFYLLKNHAYKASDELANAPYWLNVKNGMLHLDTLELKPHAPEFNSRVQLPVEYDPEADCPLWIESLQDIFADDLEKCDVLQQFFGYCLYPRIIFPAALFQIGVGRNGKGVVEHILINLLGGKNVSHISLSRMEKPFGPIELKDKLLNACAETESGSLDVTNFKKIATGDMVQAEVKYKDDITFQPIAKHMVSMNDFPTIREKTDAFFRRVIILEYKQIFSGDKDNRELKSQLMSELNGIFTWALDGLRMVLDQKHIVVPESVQLAKQRFRQKSNPVLTYIEEMCAVNASAVVLPKALYDSYKEWCEDSKVRPLGKHNFYEQIYLNCGVKKVRIGTKEWLKGVGLASNPYPVSCE